MLIGLEYKYAILSVLLGGVGGFLFFYYLSKSAEAAFYRLYPKLCKLVPAKLKQRYQLFCSQHIPRKSKKVFSKKSRFCVRVKNTYGFWGIILATPVFLTIPIGAFLASRYYANHKNTVFFMILSIVGWGGVLSGLVHLFPGIFF